MITQSREGAKVLGGRGVTETRKAAEAAGYRALTMRYFLPRQQWMLDAVVADMKRAGVNHVLVKERGGVSVWRSWRTANIPKVRRASRATTRRTVRRWYRSRVRKTVRRVAA